MKRSESRIITTHTGSLPRSSALQDLLLIRQERRQLDQDQLEAEVRAAVAEVVNHQVEIGLDVINDGEQGRAQYATYVQDRLTGFESEMVVRARPRLDDRDFPEFAVQRNQASSVMIPQPACTGPIAWKDWLAVQRDIDAADDSVVHTHAQDHPPRRIQ